MTTADFLHHRSRCPSIPSHMTKSKCWCRTHSNHCCHRLPSHHPRSPRHWSRRRWSHRLIRLSRLWNHRWVPRCPIRCRHRRRSRQWSRRLSPPIRRHCLLIRMHLIDRYRWTNHRHRRFHFGGRYRNRRTSSLDFPNRQNQSWIDPSCCRLHRCRRRHLNLTLTLMRCSSVRLSTIDFRSLGLHKSRCRNRYATVVLILKLMLNRYRIRWWTEIQTLIVTRTLNCSNTIHCHYSMLSNCMIASRWNKNRLLTRYPNRCLTHLISIPTVTTRFRTRSIPISRIANRSRLNPNSPMTQLILSPTNSPMMLMKRLNWS